MGSKGKRLYSNEVDERVRARISKFVVDALAQWGFNAFGIYEIVKEELAREAGRGRRGK